MEKTGSKRSRVNDNDRVLFSKVIVILWDQIWMPDKKHFARAMRYICEVCDTDGWTAVLGI